MEKPEVIIFIIITLFVLSEHQDKQFTGMNPLFCWND